MVLLGLVLTEVVAVLVLEVQVCGGGYPFSLGDETILGGFIVVFFFRHHLRSLPLWSLQHQFFPLWGG